MENHGQSSASNHLHNAVLILRCLLTICGLVFLQHIYQKGIRYMNYFLPTFVIVSTGLVYNLVTIWTHLGFNGISCAKFDKLEELLVITVIESYVVLSLTDAQTTKYYSKLRNVVCFLIAGTEYTMIYRLITAGTSCEMSGNGPRTIIDMHLIFIFIMLPQLATAASIMCMYPHTDKEIYTIKEEPSSQDIHPVCTEIKIDSPTENNDLDQTLDQNSKNSPSSVTTLLDPSSCTATSHNNPAENVARSNIYPSCDGVTASRNCPSCDGVTASRYGLSDGVTNCLASRSYPACETSRFCVSCTYLKWSQFLIFVYLSFVIFIMKPLCIVLQEYRYIDRHDIVNGFILLPPLVFTLGIYLLSILNPVFTNSQRGV